MKRIGILGGTFNPPHHGHLLIANEVLHSLSLDKVWFMPNQDPPHKKKSSAASDRARVEMLELAIEGHPRFEIQKIEMERGGPSYTYDTMKLLKEQNEDTEFYFIIGADMIEYLPKWYKINELLELAVFAGVGRPSYNSRTDYPVVPVDVPQMDVSSSMIRARLSQGETVRYLIPESVRKYIEENRLYGS
ncbi:nicotinate-nucleotide adenylyltransferase [Bacillus infantis]|uniref:nicotinate-nucleotide adenylyltransferase n=1 Tax=Bacillus infantis TaxID=324767 RepID=UPI003CED1E3B